MSGWKTAFDSLGAFTKGFVDVTSAGLQSDLAYSQIDFYDAQASAFRSAAAAAPVFAAQPAGVPPSVAATLPTPTATPTGNVTTSEVQSLLENDHMIAAQLANVAQQTATTSDRAAIDIVTGKSQSETTRLAWFAAAAVFSGLLLANN